MVMMSAAKLSAIICIVVSATAIPVTVHHYIADMLDRQAKVIWLNSIDKHGYIKNEAWIELLHKYRRALVNRPGHGEYYEMIGFLYAERATQLRPYVSGVIPDDLLAEKAFLKALQRSPTNSAIWARIARIRENTGATHEAAIDALKRSLFFGQYEPGSMQTGVLTGIKLWNDLDITTQNRVKENAVFLIESRKSGTVILDAIIGNGLQEEFYEIADEFPEQKHTRS